MLKWQAATFAMILGNMSTSAKGEHRFTGINCIGEAFFFFSRDKFFSETNLFTLTSVANERITTLNYKIEPVQDFFASKQRSDATLNWDVRICVHFTSSVPPPHT